MPIDRSTRKNPSDGQASTGQVVTGVSRNKSRLAVIPLAVLLPQLGTVSSLGRISSTLTRRLAVIQNAEVLSGEGEDEAKNKRIAEESMIHQIMQWLSAGTAKDN